MSRRRERHPATVGPQTRGSCHELAVPPASILPSSVESHSVMRHTFPPMDLALLDERLAAGEEPRFRARQVWEWAARGARSYEVMTNLPLGLREQLAYEVPFSSLRPVRDALASDGTEKALFETHDGRPVEAVLMRYRDGRRSLCVSSQSGCPLTCTFCATGAMRFGRNLTASEILDQALHFRRKEPVDHAVFMGMGEPLLNLDYVLDACQRWHERRRRQVFVEYLMLDGVNDRYEQALALAELLEPRRAFKLNLIPYNPTDAVYRGSGRDAIAAFRAALEERGVRTTVRLTRGRDIAAACGQLAARR